jgi:hypothetical protein
MRKGVIMQMRKLAIVIAIAVTSGLAFTQSAHAIKDHDKDGVKNADDVCPDSVLGGEAVIDSCTPSLPNELDEDGCTTQQRIDNCYTDSATKLELRACLTAIVQAEIDDGDLVLSNKEWKNLKKCIRDQRLPE